MYYVNLNRVACIGINIDKIARQDNVRKLAELSEVSRRLSIMTVFQRWAFAILVLTSAIPQYCRLPNRLRNCGKKCGTVIVDL
jgi:hypothetical protein